MTALATLAIRPDVRAGHDPSISARPLFPSRPDDHGFALFRDHINPPLGDLLARAGLATSFTSAQGSWVTDGDGRRCLDFVGGYGALPFGHNPPAMTAALARALTDDAPSMIQPFFPEAAGRLAERLSALAPFPCQRVIFANSGAESIEVALKAARMATGRARILSTGRAFHGKTMGAMAVTDMRGRDRWAGPLDERDRGFVAFGDVAALDEDFVLHGNATAAVVVEIIQGEGGVHAAPIAFLEAARALCDRHGALLIVDEVQTGLGRTGTLWACDWASVRPDCMTLAKALGGGMLPIGACLIGAAADSDLLALQHSSTFAGNRLGCVAGLATLDLLTADDGALLDNVLARSNQLQAIHAGLAEDYPDVVVDHRGVGLLLGLQIAAPADCRHEGRVLDLFAREGQLCTLLAGHLYHHERVRVAPTLMTHDVLRIEPPLTVTEEECAFYGAAIHRALGLVSRRRSAALLAHLIPVADIGDWRDADVRTFVPAVEIEPHAEEGRFAFLVHPLTRRHFADVDASLDALDDAGLERFEAIVLDPASPFPVSRVRITSPTGTSATGDFIAVPRTAEALLAMDPDAARAMVQSAIDIGIARGARFVGLGGYTSIVTRGGSTVSGNGAALTTGSSFTIVTAVKAITFACARLGVRIDRETVGIVGATGLIGGAAIALIGARCAELRLIGNAETPIAKVRRRLQAHLANAIEAWIAGTIGVDPGSVADRLLARADRPADAGDRIMIAAFAGRILDEDDGGIAISTDPADLEGCRIGIVATSSVDEVIQPEHVGCGAIICDLSLPANLSARLRGSRDDVLLIDGGTVAFPGLPDLGFNFGLDPGIGFACMAETVMLALEGGTRGASLGMQLRLEECGEVERLAERHGFTLSTLKSFGQPLDVRDWALLVGERTRPDVPPPFDVAACSAAALRAPAVAGSVIETDRLDLFDQLVGRHARDPAARHRVAVSDRTSSLSYAALDRAALAAAAVLAWHGLGVGDRIVLHVDDSTASVAAALGAWSLGASCCFVNPQTPSAVVVGMVAAIDARILLVDDANMRTPWPDRVVALTLEELAATDRAADDDAPAIRAWVPRPAGIEAACMFTSGSTGVPKAVPHSVRDLANINRNYAGEVLGLSNLDRVATSSRLFFAYGLNALHMALWAGASVTLAPPRFDAAADMAHLEAFAPTILFSVPTIYLLLLRKAAGVGRLNSLRLAISAGEPLPATVARAWHDRHGIEILDGIGTSEILSTFIANRPGDNVPGSTGRVVPGFAVVLANAFGRPAAVGEIGTLWVCGNTVAEGYVGDASLSAKLIRDGWICTNDLLYRETDGRFHYVGRANDMIKCGGIWVSPLEIERSVGLHPAVAECAVATRQEIDLLARPEAFVVLKPGYAASDTLADAIREDVRTTLLPGRAPHFVTFLDELPRTPSGKIQRFRLRALARGEISSGDHR